MISVTRWECVNIGFAFLSLSLVLTSVLKFMSEVLTPSGMLFNNVLNAVFSGASLAIDIVVYVRKSDKHYSMLGLVLDSILLYVAS